MTLPTSREAYHDYYKIWDRALADPAGIRIKTEDYDSAMFHRHRLHKARSINKDESRELYEPGDPRYNVSPYDRYMVTIRRANDSDDFYLFITPRTLGLVGQIESLSGTEYEPQWQNIEAPERTPQFMPHSGTKLLPANSDSTSELPIDKNSSEPSTPAELTSPTQISRRL